MSSYIAVVWQKKMGFLVAVMPNNFAHTLCGSAEKCKSLKYFLHVLGISPLSSTDRWKPFYRWKPFFLIISMHVHIYYNPITSPSLSITVMHHKQQIQSNVNWLIKLSSYHWKGLDAMEGPCWLDLNSDLSYFGIYKGPFPAIQNLMQSVVI